MEHLCKPRRRQAQAIVAKVENDVARTATRTKQDFRCAGVTQRVRDEINEHPFYPTLVGEERQA